MKYKQTLIKYIKEIIFIVVMVTILANIISYYKSTNLNKSSLDSKSVTLIDGTVYTLPKNKPILIHFWAIWCPICSVEASNIQTLSENFEVLTIAVDSNSVDEINTYLKNKNLTFKVINDFDKHYASKFNISVYPTTFIYDKNKNLLFSEVGYTSTFGLALRMFWATL